MFRLSFESGVFHLLFKSTLLFQKVPFLYLVNNDQPVHLNKEVNMAVDGTVRHVLFMQYKLLSQVVYTDRMTLFIEQFQDTLSLVRVVQSVLFEMVVERLSKE